MSTLTLGGRGEESAALYLEKNGYRIIGRGVRLGHLEIDIIAEDGVHLVFAEVKTRRAYPDHPSRFGRPADAVDARKRAHLTDAVRLWKKRHPGEYDALIPNIDIIEVYADPTANPYRVLEIRHFRNAVNGMKGVSHASL